MWNVGGLIKLRAWRNTRMCYSGQISSSRLRGDAPLHFPTVNEQQIDTISLSRADAACLGAQVLDSTDLKICGIFDRLISTRRVVRRLE